MVTSELLIEQRTVNALFHPAGSVGPGRGPARSDVCSEGGASPGGWGGDTNLQHQKHSEVIPGSRVWMDNKSGSCWRSAGSAADLGSVMTRPIVTRLCDRNLVLIWY